MAAKKDQAQLVAILSYLTILGWIVALVLHKQSPTKLGGFHVRQALLLIVSALVVGILNNFAFIPILGALQQIILSLITVAIVVFWIWGLVTAIQMKTEPLPVIGQWAQDWFKGL